MPPAVFLLVIACALFQNVVSDTIVCPKHVTGKVEGSVSITCAYSTVTKANKHTRKYFCKEGGWSSKCKTTITSTNGYVHPDYVDRVLIQEDTTEGIIVINLSDLRKSDEGTYICGLGTDMNRMKAVFTIAVTEDSVIPTEAKLVYGQLMGSVNFHCEFGDEHAAQRKYLCKIEKKGCKNIIDSSGAVDPAYLGRILLQKDKRPASFTVKIIQLRTEDSGMFSCGVGDYGVVGDFTELDLRINEETDIPQGSRLLSTRLGGSVSAQCKYNPKKNYTLKFWCRWEDSVCNPLIKTDGYVNGTYEGKLVIHDDPTNGTMQVLMNQISKEDEGWYWCVLTDGKHDQTSTIQIKISEGNLEGLTGGKSVSVKKGETVKIPCSYPCRLKPYEKYWCKVDNNNCKDLTSYTDDNDNGLSVSCETQQLILTIQSASLKDNGWYWCGVKKSGRYGETLAVKVTVEEATGGRAIFLNKNWMFTTPSIAENKPDILVPAILSVCAAVLIVSAVFFIVRLKRRKNSDLVSIGSYRTNISMTDLDNGIGKDNPAVIDTQETDISHSKDGPKIKKKGSQEDLDYSSFLIHHNGSPNEENTV
ncbi:polymeric immunoglobulin receptor-like [Hyla sarda]|uniref:polymeric immunoglobulin receptor-like n=1 Tax=Hyla sarda TaxID=327740 RepID=UPI0024C2596D|nr:polymeric immunoglobulin receptor-like [Hyla sarda]XP_056413964.1 polymeric immunoglobulin receptor-like [Hyla sarda]